MNFFESNYPINANYSCQINVRTSPNSLKSHQTYRILQINYSKTTNKEPIHSKLKQSHCPKPQATSIHGIKLRTLTNLLLVCFLIRRSQI